MAESSDSHFNTDRGILDVNENLPNSENHVCFDIKPELDSVPCKLENINLEDSFVCKPLNTLAENHFEIPNNFTENLNPCELDLMLQNSNGINSDIKSDSGVHDAENNILENSKLIDFPVDLNSSNERAVIISEFNNEENCVELKEEEFYDAAQFFKDPSSISFLENAGASSAPTDPLISRSSLYMNFDPLHAKFFSQPNKANDLQDIIECEAEPENTQDEIVPDIVNKHLNNVSPRESLGNILISFDSPIIGKNVIAESSDKEKNESQKLYTEEELQQALKIQELSVQETFLKRQHDLELERTQKQQELETKINELKILCMSFQSVLKELFEVSAMLSEQKLSLQGKLEDAEKENNKLKDDLKTSVEDLQSVECTFADFHKRYEQCKSMLKLYTQNEDNLKLQLEDMKVQLQEKDEMYKVLQSRTQEMLDKANTEVSNAKKAGDAQIAVLKAQLKKAELRISSLESDVKHVKIENDKLSSICDELMAKVSES